MKNRENGLKSWQKLQKRHGHYYGETKCVGFGTDKDGYEVWWTNKRTDGCDNIRVHQILAIAMGNPAEKVFSNGEFHIHHKNGIPWDNRPENIELLSCEDHARYHANERWENSRGCKP